MEAHLNRIQRWVLQNWPGRKPKEPEPPKISRSDLWIKVHDILAKQLSVPTISITPQARFVEDLMIDSLDSVELVMAMEEEFGIEITDEEAENFKSVADLLQYLERRVTNAKRSSGG